METPTASGSRITFIACCLAILAVGENSTAIMAALPEMAASLGLAPATREWVVNAYLLAAAAFIILGGEMADRLGPRRSSAIGIAIFALASAIIALAPDGMTAVGARALQGLGGAFAVAGTLATVTHTFPESGRAQAIGAWTGFLMLGFSIGPLVGGAVTHYVGWRFTFWLNVAVMLPAALALALRSGLDKRQPGPIDWRGLGLFVCFAIMLVYGLHALPAVRSAPWAALGPLALAAIAGAALPWAARSNPRPMLDFALFANRHFLLACLLGFFLMFDIMTLLLYYNLFAQSPTGLGQDGLGLSAVGAGLSLVPLSVAFFVFARSAPRLDAALGLRPMMVGGSLLLALACAIVWAALAPGALAIRTLGLVAAGAGIALPYATSPRIGLSALSPAQVGQGSGVLNSCSFLGGTVGVTCGGIVFGMTGFAGVLALIALGALVSAGLSLRLRAAERGA
jgi:predicted MFS family arabinose efflux permease